MKFLVVHLIMKVIPSSLGPRIILAEYGSVKINANVEEDLNFKTQQSLSPPPVCDLFVCLSFYGSQSMNGLVTNNQTDNT